MREAAEAGFTLLEVPLVLLNLSWRNQLQTINILLQGPLASLPTGVEFGSEDTLECEKPI